ncbi:hypothetical protein JB92DRAFT_2826580 [Gautieria morchelliformis]|nr:hypothetical protein JB92DRAFT_2826580 [Gautieria morchelliformis]
MVDKTTHQSQNNARPRTPPQAKFPCDAAAIMRKLTDLGYYLGHGDIAMKVAFIAGGRMGDRLVAHDDVNDSQPEEVRLSLVGEVSRDGAWLTPEGAYRPALKLNPGEKITGAKARIGKYLTNIRSIHEAALKDCAHRTERKEPVQNAGRLTVRHPLVIRRRERMLAALMMQISFGGWPVSHAWRKELDAVKATHDVNPLPAYNIDHSMIAPKDYERCLLGAAVEVHVTLIHYLIGKKGSTMVANLREMIVLRPPRGLPQSPTKRSLIAGPSSISPKKQ